MKRLEELDSGQPQRQAIVLITQALIEAEQLLLTVSQEHDVRDVHQIGKALLSLGDRLERSIWPFTVRRLQLQQEIQTLWALVDELSEVVELWQRQRLRPSRDLEPRPGGDWRLPPAPELRADPAIPVEETTGKLIGRLEHLLAQVTNHGTGRGLSTAVAGAALSTAALFGALPVGAEPPTHVVQFGDTLTKISQRYFGFPAYVRKIAAANGITNPDLIFAGATLRLPEPDQPVIISGATVETVVVQPGDTLRGISARLYGDEARYIEIAGANGIQNPDLIFPGTVLKVPHRTAEAVATVVTADRLRERPAFIWPAQGVTIPAGRFGTPRQSGPAPYHTGLDLAAPQGTAIVAAADGTVVHAGWEDEYYGNTVIIDHGNGYMTRYAHLLSWKVNAGATVQQGQGIGLMGSTGNSYGPHLHFEVIKEGTFINPSTILS